MTQPAFDSASFGGRPSTPPPVPMVVCWDDLDPTAYIDQLSDLAEWIAWFRSTYRVPATVLPPCWFTHPSLREDIGHLWTGWLLTRHPDAGVGMIGLDWDQRREAAINRLREATAITGCTATRHQAEPEPNSAQSATIEELWTDHVDTQTSRRSLAVARQAAIDIVAEILAAAEPRHDLAPAVLADLVNEPSADGDDIRDRIAQSLSEQASDAVQRAALSARDAARTIVDGMAYIARESEVADARDDLAAHFAHEALTRTASAQDAPAGRWLDALEKLLPASIAAERAVAAAKARAAAVDHRIAAKRRHPGVDDLLK